jgi:fructose 1,6-bisphosphate aldolase/phosphatase
LSKVDERLPKRTSHAGRLDDATPTRFDGPPRVIAAGFQVTDTHLVGPADMFDDPGFDMTRDKANEIGEYLRRHGPFEPHRLPADQMETRLPSLLAKLKDRFKNAMACRS